MIANNKPITLTATYRITTPMFCSGVDQQKAELRLPSFKGALRFWWRSLHGHLPVTELREREANLFGASDQNVGQSKVRMQMANFQPLEQGDDFQWAQLKGCQYLGYGVMGFRGRLIRPVIPGGTFSVHMRCHTALEEAAIEDVEKALILLGTVGGIGSKARKGFGSLTLTELNRNDKSIELPDDPHARLKQSLPGSLPKGQPGWTAWSQTSRVVQVTGGSDRPIDLLDALGREQVHYRSWGRNGNVLGKDSEKNFTEDHHLSKGQQVEVKHPKRIAFGLPHNYGRSDREQVKPSSKELDRRASPLFLHLHQIGESDSPQAMAIFLPARFLPDGEQIRAFGMNVPLNTEDLWQPIHGYLDRLLGKKDATKKKINLTGKEVSLD